ncbi:MAG: hypothetical protein H7293_02640 [Candidatus Saccharibacteria bacterium]|nr:hypothetical protein [Rhodoferax sp.]
MKKLVLVAVVACSQAHAQVDAKGVWQFPVSAKTYCQNNEQNLVATYKSLIESSRRWSDNTIKEDKSQYPQIAEALKNSIKEYEESWRRMDCTSLIYGNAKR